MPWRIKEEGSRLLYLVVEIDSGGMGLFWTTRASANVWPSEAEAEDFAVRIGERYPHLKLEIIKDDT